MKLNIIVGLLIGALFTTPSNARLVKKKVAIPTRIKVPFVSSEREIAPHSSPWQAALTRYQNNTLDPMCGGALIAPNVVVTAAQCCRFVKRSSGYFVVLGAHNISSVEKNRQHILVSQTIIHPDYLEGVEGTTILPENDICLLLLGREAKLNTAVGTVRLPSSAQPAEDFANQDAFSIGWGLTNIGMKVVIKKGNQKHTSASRRNSKKKSILPSAVLKSNTYTVLTNEDCQSRFEEVAIFPPKINPSTLCVSGHAGENNCHGDLGGPLTVTGKNGEQTLVGLMSAGVSPCERGLSPSFFTRITSYLDWISQTTGLKMKKG